MTPTATWLLTLGAAAATATAEPQEAPSSASSDATIVVTGKKEETPARKEVYDQALELSRLDPRRLYDEPAARFEAPLCPSVLGVKDQPAQLIIDRIRANAARLKLRLARPGCSSNFIVGFLEDSRSLLNELRRDHPRIFQLVEPGERDELLNEDGPVRVWNNIRTMGAGGPVPIWRGKEEIPSISRKTEMFLPMRKEIISTLVAFDRRSVIGLTVTQLADYATMRGLSHTRPAGAGEPLSTILALFADSAPPPELTPFDLGYLRSLYFDRPDARAVSKLLGVRRREVGEMRTNLPK